MSQFEENDRVTITIEGEVTYVNNPDGARESFFVRYTDHDGDLQSAGYLSGEWLTKSVEPVKVGDVLEGFEPISALPIGSIVIGKASRFGHTRLPQGWSLESGLFAGELGGTVTVLYLPYAD